MIKSNAQHNHVRDGGSEAWSLNLFYNAFAQWYWNLQVELTFGLQESQRQEMSAERQNIPIESSGASYKSGNSQSRVT